MTRVLALAGQSKIGCITQRRFAKAGTKTHSQRGAALDRNGLSVSTETACRFEPKSPVGNSEICILLYQKGRDSRIFQAQDRTIDDFTWKGLPHLFRLKTGFGSGRHGGSVTAERTASYVIDISSFRSDLR